MRHLILTLILTASAFAADWKKDVVFRATFDGSLDAKVANGDPKLYTAKNYKELNGAQANLSAAPVEWAKGIGRNGDALRFTRKNSNAVFFHAKGNIPFEPKQLTGTISFWLKLDPENDLTDYADPIQVTDKAYNNSAIWVDFSKDENPRHFRLGVFGSIKGWNTPGVAPDKDPNFNNRLVTVKRHPFSNTKWTHVAVAYSRLGSGEGEARLYLDGKLIGTTQRISEAFEWDIEKCTIRLGMEYKGLFDDLAIFNRQLEAHEIAEIASLTNW